MTKFAENGSMKGLLLIFSLLTVLTGRVTDSRSGKPVSGAVVSDGCSCVKTGRNGEYFIESDSARVVFVVTPSGYRVPFDGRGLFSGYRHIEAGVENYDFTLEPHSGNSDSYTILLLGDPQVMSSRPHSGESWKWVTEKLDSYRKSVDGDLYQILLGDMVVNEIEVEGRAASFIETLSSSHINTLCIPGNHDHIQGERNYRASTEKYVEHFGPYNYALNIGKVHYVFFDTPSSGEGIIEESYRFLKEDLKFVPGSVPVVICTHCPMTRCHGGKYPSKELPNYRKMMELLKDRRVSFWYGHIHFNSFWSYGKSELREWAPGVRSLESNVVGRCGGSWACSGEIGRDGSPRGMVEMKVERKKITWRYRSLDEKYPDDFLIIPPGAFKGEGIADDDALYCNVYAWDEKWGLPELWKDGRRIGTLERCTGEYLAVADPLYSHWYPIWKAQNIKGFREEYPRDYDNSHLFKITPHTSLDGTEIRIRDRWGRTLVRRPYDSSR